MLKRLRTHLTLLSTVITSLILFVICLIALQISEKQLSDRNHFAFQSHLNTIAYHLQYNQTVSHSWLGRLEFDNRLIISIKDNGAPLLFKGTWQPKSDRVHLIDTATSISTNKYQFDPSIPSSSTLKISQTFFQMQGQEGEWYRCGVAIIPSTKGTYTLTLLQDIQNELSSIIHTRILFISISILGVSLLGLFSWWFSGRAIRPIEINQKKQVEFIAAASHELKSPLAVLRASTSVLTPSNSEEQRFISNIENECTHMARLVDDLLLLATADAKTWSIYKSPLEVDTLLLDLFEIFLPIAVSKNRILKLNLPDYLIEPLLGDSERINQVISILLNNALHYVPELGEITLDLTSTHSFITLKIIDNGPGISDLHKPYIFDRFYRVDSSRKDKNHYGLGLSIAYEIIQLHQGSLSVADTPGGGCTFIIKLPYLPSDFKK